jgi:hypothetical protein
MDTISLVVENEYGQWLLKMLPQLQVAQSKRWLFSEVKADFEMQFDDFELFWFSKSVQTLKRAGLLSL